MQPESVLNADRTWNVAFRATIPIPIEIWPRSTAPGTPSRLAPQGGQYCLQSQLYAVRKRFALGLARRRVPAEPIRHLIQRQRIGPPTDFALNACSHSLPRSYGLTFIVLAAACDFDFS